MAKLNNTGPCLLIINKSIGSACQNNCCQNGQNTKLTFSQQQNLTCEFRQTEFTSAVQFRPSEKKMHSYSWITSLTTTVCQIWVNNSPISHWDWTILLGRHDTFPSETSFTSQLCNKIFLLSVRWIHLFPPNLNFWFDYIPQSKHFTILTLHILSIRKW